MTKARSGPLDEDDIVTPSAHSTAGNKAGPGLRMPPIIDISPSFGLRLIDGTKNLLRGTLYQASLIALLLMALGLMVLTLMQAGNISPPDWRQLVVSLEGVRGEDAAPATEVSPPQARTPLDAEEVPIAPLQDSLPQDIALPEVAESARETDLAGLKPVTPREPNPPSAMDTTLPPAPEMQAEMAALRQTLADTRRDLATAQAALLEKQTATSGTELAQLTKRARLAELLLRLDAGVAFDDLLDGGQLDDVLSKNELAALALHAARGVPTEAGIRAQAETLPLIISGTTAGDDPLPGIISWLAAKAPKLITIRQSPMAGAQKQLRVLYEQLQARDYRAAAATTRLLVLTYDEGAPDAENKPMLALQALYADLSAFSETRAARNDLRRDYMAGVRP